MDGSPELPLKPGVEYGWDSVSKVHRQHHGINSKGGIARSIMVEVHPDAPYPDRWLVPGRVLDYVGHGAAPTNQSWDKYNLPLRRALEEKAPVHVIEKVGSDPSRYVYHGTWHVLEANETLTGSGRTVLRFVLSADPEWRGSTQVATDASPDTPAPPGRMQTTIQRIIRDTPLATRTKVKHDYACALCGLRQLRGDGTPYAEAHHIQPLGHDGPDVLENLIVLCARHHVDFDFGAVAIDITDRQTIRHKHDAQLNGSKLRKELPAIAAPYLLHHWEQIFSNKR